MLKKIGFGVGLRDGSGCGKPFGTITHGEGLEMCNCRRLTQEDEILQAPHANRKIVLLTVAHSGTPALLIRRQLHILGAQELAFADSCTFFLSAWGPGSWAVACCVSSSY